MWLMIILKVTKNHSFTASLKNIFLEKPQEGGSGKLAPLAFLGLTKCYTFLGCVFDGSDFWKFYTSPIFH